MSGRRMVALLLVLAWSPTTFAQSDRELATRSELIAQASVLSDQGNHAEALSLAKRAAAIETTPSLRLFLAGEQSALLLLADAYGNSRQCSVEAAGNMHLNNRDRILAACKDLEEALGKRVARVTVDLAPPVVPNVRVTVSGEEISHALLGESYVVSPGKITVAATASGFLPFSSEIELPEGGSTRVEVRLQPDPSVQVCAEGQERVDGACVASCAMGKVRPAGESAQCCWKGQTWSAATNACIGAPQCPAGLVARAEECVPWSPVAAAPPEAKSHRRIWAAAVGGAGLAGIVVGSAFGLMAVSEWSTAKSLCPQQEGCPGQAVDDQRVTTTLGTVSTAAFVAGGVFLAGGLTLYFTAPKEHGPSPGVQVGPGSAGLFGRF